MSSATAYVEMTTDSDYVRLGITNWLADWTAREWRTAGKAPVKIRIYGAGSTSRRRGIKSPGVGSEDTPDTRNELADALASRGIDELED